jgi:hypothetical protein
MQDSISLDDEEQVRLLISGALTPELETSILNYCDESEDSFRSFWNDIEEKKAI